MAMQNPPVNLNIQKNTSSPFGLGTGIGVGAIAGGGGYALYQAVGGITGVFNYAKDCVLAAPQTFGNYTVAVAQSVQDFCSANIIESYAPSSVKSLLNYNVTVPEWSLADIGSQSRSIILSTYAALAAPVVFTTLSCLYGSLKRSRQVSRIKRDTKAVISQSEKSNFAAAKIALRNHKNTLEKEAASLKSRSAHPVLNWAGKIITSLLPLIAAPQVGVPVAVGAVSCAVMAKFFGSLWESYGKQDMIDFLEDQVEKVENKLTSRAAIDQISLLEQRCGIVVPQQGGGHHPPQGAPPTIRQLLALSTNV